MKFDPKKPYGVITNHDWARFEQGGILYDCQGNPNTDFDSQSLVGQMVEDEPKEVDIIFSKEKKDYSLNNAKDFLTNILADGPLARSVIFKESSSNNQDWEKVKTAFADLGGEAFQRRNIIHWKLKPN